MSTNKIYRSLIVINLILGIIFSFNSCKKFEDTDCPACPCVIALSPPQAKPDDYIKIIGEQFGNNVENVQVKFNGILSPEILSVKSYNEGNDTIIAKVPSEYSSGPVEVIVRGLSTNDSTDLSKCNPVNFTYDQDIEMIAGRPRITGYFDTIALLSSLSRPIALSVNTDPESVFFSDNIGFFDHYIRRIENNYIQTVDTTIAGFGEDIKQFTGIKDECFYYFGGYSQSNNIYKFNTYNNTSIQYITIPPNISPNSNSLTLDRNNNKIIFNSVDFALKKIYIYSVGIGGLPILNLEFTVNCSTIDLFGMDRMAVTSNNEAVCYFERADSSGNNWYSYVLKINLSNQHVDTLIKYPFLSSNSYYIGDIAVDNYNTIFCASGSKIYRLNSQNNLVAIAGEAGKGFKNDRLSNSKFDGIRKIVFDDLNRLYILEDVNNIIRRVQL